MSTSSNSSSNEYADYLGLTPDEFAALPHGSNAQKLLASIWTLWCVATGFLILRIYCRMLRGQRLWWDDGILIASWVCVLIESALLTHMTTLGYGLHFWDFPLNNIQAIMLPTNVAGTFSVTAAVWSKTSFGLTLLKITDGWIKKLTWFCIISMNIAMGLSALFPWVYCSPIQKAWDLSVQGGSCWAMSTIVSYDIFSSAYSAFMDLVFSLLPWKFLWGLQMKRNEKIGVGLAMSMGVFAGVTAIVKTTKVPAMLSMDMAEQIDLWIWGNAESCASIIAASIPMLRVLVREAKSSRNYHSSAYADQNALSGNVSRFVTITSRAAPATTSDVELHKMGDDGSDRSILGSNGEGPQGKGGIVQVTNITVQYDRDEAQGNSSS
ncbi:hypothetical protein C8A03DRAFT_39037 [Achaetomium macrosporum]|uniref:Rhodopsin domain-containing protein n=1 Tax=Achaetomium macrosporum TaxID=79813 RepID=A0AAN7C0Y8_9PEZI|nr:hypothetical protein C8A03DRAFT_39037 [Achaetomium macrosporum]